MRERKIKLTIGEFSRLCYVTVKTLRHYEKLGLLSPHEVDEWTGYRYYDVDQMADMVRIKNLKQLGLSLDEICEMFQDGLQQPDQELINQKITHTQKEIDTLSRRLNALQKLRNNATKEKEMRKITIKPLPSGIVASWRSHLSSYSELGPKLLSIVQPEMRRLGCICPPETAYCFTMDHNDNHTPNDIDVEYCEIVAEACEDTDILKFKKLPLVENAVCIEHRGDYDSFDSTMTEVFRYIEESQWTIDGKPRFNYIHGVWDCEREEDWLTEVQIPVRKA